MSSQPLLRRAFDGGVEIELFRGALAREAAQAAQRDLDVARAELAGESRFWNSRFSQTLIARLCLLSPPMRTPSGL
jgi:hypothetical protein